MDDLTDLAPSGSPFLEAVFVDTATGPSSVVMVVISAFSPDHTFGDPDGVVWTPVDGQYPQKGDRALVAESDDGSWWVLAWKPS